MKGTPGRRKERLKKGRFETQGRCSVVERTVYLRQPKMRDKTTRTNPRRGSDGATGETKPFLCVSNEAKRREIR